MASPTTVALLVKKAIDIVSDKRVRTFIASVIVGIVVIILIPFLAILSIFNAEAGYSRETAKIVFPKNSFEIDNRIIERSFGKLEGKKGIPDYEEKIEEFGIETVENLEKRIKSFLNCICKKHKENEKILVVTHGGIAQIINNILDKNYNNNNFKEFMLENSKYVCYEIKGRKNGY